MLVLIVLLNAALQVLVIAIAPRDALSPVGALFAVVSGIAVVAAAWLLGQTVVPAAAAGLRLAWTAVVGFVVVLAALAVPYGVPLVVAVGAAIVVAGSPQAAWVAARGHPIRTILLLIVTAIAVLIGWAAAVLFGLLLGGVVATATTWLLAGVLAALLALAWARWLSSDEGANRNPVTR